MSLLDWFVVGAYLLGMLILAAVVGTQQSSRKDYYLGGGRLPAWSLATSTIATQCSTNSLLGAPAFVGFVAGGGMIWLQYELAVPLAMLVLMFLFLPMRQSAFISVYEFLEERLGSSARLLASTCFQLFRGVATGVTVYGVALVITLLVDVSYTQAVLILMGVTIAYDVLGGMRAVVISDVIQIVLIIGAVLASLLLLTGEVGAFSALFEQRTDALDFTWGLDHSGNYGFWPMLIGGLFLYVAYYGCDQSQAQRVLAAASPDATRRVLLLNGLLRFPLVLLYCLLGLALAAYAAQHDFVSLLPLQENGQRNFNLAMTGKVHVLCLHGGRAPVDTQHVAVGVEGMRAHQYATGQKDTGLCQHFEHTAIGCTGSKGAATDQHSHQFFPLLQVRRRFFIEGLLFVDQLAQGLGVTSQRELALGAANHQFHVPVAVTTDGFLHE